MKLQIFCLIVLLSVCFKSKSQIALSFENVENNKLDSLTIISIAYKGLYKLPIKFNNNHVFIDTFGVKSLEIILPNYESYYFTLKNAKANNVIKLQKILVLDSNTITVTNTAVKVKTNFHKFVKRNVTIWNITGVARLYSELPVDCSLKRPINYLAIKMETVAEIDTIFAVFYDGLLNVMNGTSFYEKQIIITRNGKKEVPIINGDAPKFYNKQKIFVSFRNSNNGSNAATGACTYTKSKKEVRGYYLKIATLNTNIRKEKITFYQYNTNFKANSKKHSSMEFLFIAKYL